MILLLKGLPASGKSTWALDKVSKDRTFIRINKDDLRAMCHHGKWDSKREAHVLAMRDAMVEAALERGLNPIVDDTNLHPKHERRMREIAKKFKTTVEVRVFAVDVETCIERDAQRSKPVGENVIRRMYRDFLQPQPQPQNTSLPPAIIVDVDGTVALMGDRSPYDDHLAEDDTPNWSVIDVIDAYLRSHPETSLIIMSGRDEGRSREVTARWLKNNWVNPDVLLMRPAGDTRKDSIIKRELYDQHVKDKFFVAAVFDDRDQVVRMWRDDLGLPTFQVNWGDF